MSPRPAGQVVTVMVVDDNEDHRHLMTRRLSEAGFVVQPAASAGEALALADQVDLVLLDNRLPGANGIEVLGALRQRGPSVIMVTGVGSETLAVEALRQGASDYVVKNPGYLAELPGVVERAWLHRDLEQRAGELQRLSLLVSSAVDRTSTFHEIVQGARRLLRADACALFVTGGDGVDLEAFDGDERYRGTTLRDAAVRVLTQSPSDATRASSPAQEGGRLLVPLPSPDDTPMGVLITVRPSKDAYAPEEVALARTFASYAGIALSNLARLELERTLVAELQQMLELRRSLVASVSHELRTPLTCIVGFTATLLRRWPGLGDEARLDMLERIDRSGRDLSELVEQLLDFAAVEAGRVEVRAAPIQLAPLLESIFEDLAPLLGDREVLVDLAAPAVDADPSLLRRTLANLLSNAAKYTDPGTPVTVRTRMDQGSVRIDVIDEGPGLTADEVTQVFNPFWRAKHSMAGLRGTGLGLNLVQEYIRRMGGQVWVTSSPDTGSTFSVTVPFSVSDPVAGKAAAS
jgi:signal transduction histidine kinase/ActR/RegA family two-component response regulator